jgi:hypothetical protein
MNTKDIRYAVSVYLPDELQDMIWRKYHSTHVLPILLPIVEERLKNKEYEALLDTSVHTVDVIIRSLIHFKSTSDIGFNVSMDFVEDRVLDDSWDNGLFDMYCTIKDNIHHYQLLKDAVLSTLHVTSQSKTEALRSRVSTLRTLWRMIIPQEYDDSDDSDDIDDGSSSDNDMS